jgi:hypothetical protein
VIERHGPDSVEAKWGNPRPDRPRPGGQAGGTDQVRRVVSDWKWLVPEHSADSRLAAGRACA